jgi:hypothetical protein
MKFRGQVVVDVCIEISEDLMDEVMSPDWRAHFYNFKSREEVAANLAYNLCRNTNDVTSLDGFAHRNVNDAVLVEEDWTSEDFEKDKA